ncbi:MAG: biotin/lipoyl-binding protein [Proteobacteria bacterium]|nr:biotin/lipoyl-binding protein [Pseudomonadota bacterium]
MPPNKPDAPVLAPQQAQIPESRAATPRQRTKDELAFLPAAIEIMESPASPAARAVALTMAAFFTIAVIWAIFGKVDVGAIAQGRIVPTGGVQTIQPLEIGVVRAIHVRDGQAVKQGEMLIELDPTESEVDKEQMQRERLAALIELARLRAYLRAGWQGSGVYRT